MDIAHEAEVTEATACTVYQWLREVCTTHLLHTPIRLRGPGIVVQINKSLMNHKPKVKYIINEAQWGGACLLLTAWDRNISINYMTCTVSSWAETSNGAVGFWHG